MAMDNIADENGAYLAGLEFSNFSVTKCRFHTKHFQGTFFKNGFCKEKIIVFFYPQSPYTNSSPKLFVYHLSPEAEQYPTIATHINNRLSVLLDKSKESNNQAMKAQGSRELLKAILFLTLKKEAGASSLYIKIKFPLFYHPLFFKKYLNAQVRINKMVNEQV